MFVCILWKTTIIANCLKLHPEANMVVKEVNDIVTDKVFSTIIHRNSKVGEAPSLGQPVIIYDVTSKGATNFLNLANEFLQQNTDSIFKDKTMQDLKEALNKA